MMTKNPYLSIWLGLLLALIHSGAMAQIEVERTVTSNMVVPDNGTRSGYFIWSNAGISVVSSTAITLNFSSPFASNPAVWSQLASSLTFGAGGGTPVTSSLFSAGGLSSASQTFTSEGFDGNWQNNNRWDLSVTDTQGGGIAKLDSWKLAVEGTAAGAGSTLDLSQGGTVRVSSNAGSTQTLGNVATGSAGNTATVEAGSGKTLEVAGVVSGAGSLTKNGAGEAILSGSSANTFTGATTVSSGTLRLNKSAGTTAISGSSIAVNTGGTLILGAANQIGDTTAVSLGGGVLDTGGFADAAGKLTVSANSTIQGLNGTSDFVFSDIDLSTYAGSTGSALTLLGTGGNAITSGSVIRISSSNYTSWSGYNTASFNNFQSKLSFNDQTLQAQINFSGGYTTLTAIPEPKVYLAAAGLVILIGWTEYRRRRPRDRAAV